MNWVGGSRSRFVAKSDAKKQREFFEKRKMHQKLQHLGVAMPASPAGSSSGSMDLMTLFIVNQIAARKETRDPPKVAVLGRSKGGSKRKRNEHLVLPMSPCSPSQLHLVEGEPQCSAEGQRKRKHVIPPAFKCRQLSPVLESAFSDNSAADYLPPTTNALSPFSSTSSASLGQGQVSGIFPPQLNFQQRSQTQAQRPPPWDAAGLGQTKFQPFSRPRGMTDCTPWSCGPNPLLCHLESPTAAQVLFRSPEPDNSEAWDQARCGFTFSLNQLEDQEPMLDFMLNQSEREQQFEADVFRGFSTEEVSHFGRGTSKIYLKDASPAASSTPQTVPDSQCTEVEEGNHIRLSNCADGNFSAACLEPNDGSMNGCEYAPSYFCRGGYLSSDSDDDDECCQPRLQASSSHMGRAFCADSLDSHMGSQGIAEQRHTKPRPITPLLKPGMSFRDDQEVMENVVCRVEARGSHSQQTGSNTPPFASPPAPAQSQSSELCECKKTPAGTRDAGTQTVDNLTAETCDASTQCSAVAEAAGLDSGLPPVDASVQHPATWRQTDTAAEPSAHTPSADKRRSGEKHTPWTKKQSGAGSLSGSSFINKCTDGRGIPQRPIKPFLDALSMTDGRGKESREGRDERGQQENVRPMKGLSHDAREEDTSGTRANGLAEEAETLQEIADILLVLKKRKEDEWRK